MRSVHVCLVYSTVFNRTISVLLLHISVPKQSFLWLVISSWNICWHGISFFFLATNRAFGWKACSLTLLFLHWQVAWWIQRFRFSFIQAQTKKLNSHIDVEPHILPRLDRCNFFKDSLVVLWFVGLTLLFSLPSELFWTPILGDHVLLPTILLFLTPQWFNDAVNTKTAILKGEKNVDLPVWNKCPLCPFIGR